MKCPYHSAAPEMNSTLSLAVKLHKLFGKLGISPNSHNYIILKQMKPFTAIERHY